MDRKRIEKIINELDNIYEKYTDDEFNVGLYIYVKLGKFEFDNYICDDEIEKMNEVLKRHSTLFDEEINDEVRLILNDDEDEEEED